VYFTSESFELEMCGRGMRGMSVSVLFSVKNDCNIQKPKETNASPFKYSALLQHYHCKVIPTEMSEIT